MSPANLEIIKTLFMNDWFVEIENDADDDDLPMWWKVKITDQDYTYSGESGDMDLAFEMALAQLPEPHGN